MLKIKENEIEDENMKNEADEIEHHKWCESSTNPGQNCPENEKSDGPNDYTDEESDCED